jgi:hypothetical protein
MNKYKDFFDAIAVWQNSLTLNPAPKESRAVRYLVLPHPKSLSKGEGLYNSAPLAYGEGLGVRLSNVWQIHGK